MPPSEVSARLVLYGKNVLKEADRPPVWKHFSRHILHPFSILLVIAGALAFAVREPVLGVTIWVLVLFNSAFSFWREHRAEEAMQALRELLPNYARLQRAGEELRVPVAELVPGDILVLAEGDYVAADARVVEEYGLRVSNATLTGEAVPARKTADASFREGISELERPNLIFAGSSIVSGTGKAVVYATGMLTQFGRIATLTQTAAEEASLFQKELNQVTRKIAVIVLIISGFIFLVGLTDVGLGLREAFLLSLGVLVAAIPEGLPANVTLSLAAAALRLAQKGVLVHRLSAIENLGAISVICTDKSGTLTQNQMTVKEIWSGGERWTLTGGGYDPAGEIVALSDPVDRIANPATGAGDLDMLLTAASLCNNSRLSAPVEGKPGWTYLGDQTEAAMRVAAIKGGIDERLISEEYPRVHELPFDARRKRMSTIHRVLADGEAFTPAIKENSAVYFGHPAADHRKEIAFVKGAPREVIDLCTHICTGDLVVEMDDRLRKQATEANDAYAAQALRVLALAYRDLPPRSGAYTVDKVERGLIFLGLMAMHDPPRPEVQQAVRICKEAGIRMVMVTGDYGLTAAALGKRIGMLDSTAVRIVTGNELEVMRDDDLQQTLGEEVVYARMAPEHKLKLVAAFQAKGEVVAVTGDGVNDAPALRKADIGVAMGITGTDVAQKAADIVLTNDNFLLLTSAIEEGRAVYDNLRKFITYIFSSNVPEVLPFVLTALTHLPLALTVRQILAIDMGTDMLPGLALGVERPEPGIMRRPPRKRSERLIDREVLRRAFLWLGLIEALLAFGGFFLVYALFAKDLSLDWKGLETIREWISPVVPSGEHSGVYILAVTVYHAGVVMAQVGNAFACRTETQRGRTLGWLRNRQLWIAVAVEIIIILALVYIPPLARMFNHTPIPPVLWLWLALYGPILYFLDSLRKTAARQWRGNENHHHGMRPGRRTGSPADGK